MPVRFFSTEFPARGLVAHRALRAGLIAAVLAAGLAGCRPSAAPPAPDPLRVGMSVAHRGAELKASYAPLVQHLGKRLGVRTEMILVPTAGELAERFHRGEIDLAHFSGVDFVLAERRDGAAPVAMRPVDVRCHSIVIVRAGLAGKFPDDLRGRSFVFGPAVSTSGHGMPRHFFAQMSIVPEEFFGAVRHLATHDEVIAAVVEGRADAGVVNGPLLRRRIDTRAVDPGRFRQAWVSPPYSDYVWAVPARFARGWGERLLDAFLALDADNPEDNRILAPLAAGAFVPAARADFDHVRQAVTGYAGKDRP
jgi:phosphonate transport system substrate-binding protein